MAKTGLPLDDFRVQVANVFQSPLNSGALDATEDFWINWESLYSGFRKGKIAINVDALRLSHTEIRYHRYHVVKNIGIILSIAGVIVAIFILDIGIYVTIVGIIIYLFGNYVRSADAKEFSERLLGDARRKPADGGMAGICAHYIAGTIELASGDRRAHWPQHPSNVLTGSTTFMSIE